MPPRVVHRASRVVPAFLTPSRHGAARPRSARPRVRGRRQVDRAGSFGATTAGQDRCDPACDSRLVCRADAWSEPCTVGRCGRLRDGPAGASPVDRRPPEVIRRAGGRQPPVCPGAAWCPPVAGRPEHRPRLPDEHEPHAAQAVGRHPSTCARPTREDCGGIPDCSRGPSRRPGRPLPRRRLWTPTEHGQPYRGRLRPAAGVSLTGRPRQCPPPAHPSSGHPGRPGAPQARRRTP